MISSRVKHLFLLKKKEYCTPYYLHRISTCLWSFREESIFAKGLANTIAEIFKKPENLLGVRICL